jgi:hypothetical protein
MLAASHHRPGGAPRASSLMLARGAAFGGPPGLPPVRSFSTGGAVRRSFPGGSCGGRLGWWVREATTAGAQEGAPPADGRRPSNRSVRALRAPLPTHRP